MKIFDKFIDRFRGILIPFIIIGVITVILFGGIFHTILNLVKRYSTEIILFVGTLVFVVPITIAVATDWEIPGLLILYDFIYGVGVLIMLASSVDNKYYEEENGYRRYHDYSSSNIEKTYGYNNRTYFQPYNREKERNGGLTDKEVTLKKQLIREKLEKNNLLDRTTKEKEEVTTNE